MTGVTLARSVATPAVAVEGLPEGIECWALVRTDSDWLPLYSSQYHLQEWYHKRLEREVGGFLQLAVEVLDREL